MAAVFGVIASEDTSARPHLTGWRRKLPEFSSEFEHDAGLAQHANSAQKKPCVITRLDGRITMCEVRLFA